MTRRWDRWRSNIQAQLVAILMGGLRLLTLGQFPPVLAVGALIVEDGRMLLLHRPDGTFTLPGGVVRYGETCLGALHREVREETGIEIIAEDIQGIYSNPQRGGRFHSVTIVYRCRLLSGELSSTYEGRPIWVPLDEPPVRWSRDAGLVIQDYLAGRRRMG
ncbi:MAG: NUDIX hydrolase [Anaerolineae bacterium]